MSSGQPKAKIQPDQCKKLALSLRQRKLKKALPPVMTLFNVGRISAGLFALVALLLFWGSSSVHFAAFAPALVIGLAFACLILLLLVLVQGARLGFYGLAEFICGLCHLPLKLIGGGELTRRNYHMLALIYNGMGRFREALSCFKRTEGGKNVFENTNVTAWNERHRLPETLVRLGRDQEALALALHNIEGDRSDLKDLDCQQLRENLQCDLIVAAQVLSATGDGDQAILYLQEAIDQEAAGKERINSSTKVLALYARGLLCANNGQYEQAVEALEQCRDEILQQRSTDKFFKGKINSELLGYTQGLLSQCAVKCGQLDKLAGAVKIISFENRTEPAASVDKIILDLAEVDYKISLGERAEALIILETAIFALSNSDAPYDRLLIQVCEKYQELLEQCDRKGDAGEIAKSIESLEAPHLATAANTVSLQPAVAPLQPAVAPRLPDLSATRNIANRSVFLFVSVLGYTLINYAMKGNEFPLASWAVLCAIALFMCGRSVYGQVQNRKAVFFASQALAKSKGIDVVLKPQGQLLPGVAFKNCSIEEGPPDLITRKLEFAINNNLLYASQACAASQNSLIKARLYQNQSDGSVLAIETLGRVLTVSKEWR